LAWGHGGYTGVIFLCLGLVGLGLLPFTILTSKKL